jgi:hypothetical protein
MNPTPYVETLQDHLVAVGASGDEQAQRTAALLAASLEPAMRLAVMNVAGEIAVEVTEALGGDPVVEIRLDDGDVRVAVAPLPAEPAPIAAEEEHTMPPDDAGNEPSRITLRLPEKLKTAAERAAAAQSVSLNTWLARAVREALVAERTVPAQTSVAGERAHRIRGWVQG